MKLRQWGYYCIGGCYMAYLKIREWLMIPQIKSIKKGETSRWNRVDGDLNTASSDGSRYNFYYRGGNPTKLMIYFSGGGLVWDEISAKRPMTLKRYVSSGEFGDYIGRMPPFGLHPMMGLLDESDTYFNQWSIVYIPYTTGDLHMGKQHSGKPLFGGGYNVQSIIKWMAVQGLEPEHLLIAGESAGGIGAMIHAPEIIRLYPQAFVTCLADSSQIFYQDSPHLIKKFGVTDNKIVNHFKTEDLLLDAYGYLMDVVTKPIQLLECASLRDRTLIDYWYRMNDKEQRIKEADAGDIWNHLLLEHKKKCENYWEGFYTYYTGSGYTGSIDRTEHVMTRQKRFVTFKDQQTTVQQWLIGALEKEPFHVEGRIE